MKNLEYFEVSSSRTRTRWIVRVSGRGVVPSYVLKPRFRVARFDVIDEKQVEVRLSMLNIIFFVKKKLNELKQSHKFSEIAFLRKSNNEGTKIQNTGGCPLIFRLFLVDVLEGEILRESEETPEKQVKKKKDKSVGESEGKSAKKVEFSDNLRPNEELAIFGGNLQRSVNPDCFSFTNLDENMQLLVPERKKVEFGVRFQSLLEVNVSQSKGTVETTSKKKGKKDKTVKKDAEVRKSYYCHVALVKLMLGRSTVQEFVMICTGK
ncbi:hypothetical protein ANTRET_LOCUS10174 [Anthophora retusa]